MSKINNQYSLIFFPYIIIIKISLELIFLIEKFFIIVSFISPYFIHIKNHSQFQNLFLKILLILKTSIWILKHWSTINLSGVTLVSTILCPHCKTKVSKKAEICYKCKKHLKPRKKSLKVNFNTKSRIDFRIFAIGLLVFVLTNTIFLYISSEYAMLIAGFATMLFLYLVFKFYFESENDAASLRRVGIKIIIYYFMILVVGVILLLLFKLY